MGRSAACSPARQGWHDERVLMSPHQLSRYSNDDERGSPGGEETTHLYDSDKAVVPVGPVGEVRLWHVRSCGADPTTQRCHTIMTFAAGSGLLQPILHAMPTTTVAVSLGRRRTIG